MGIESAFKLCPLYMWSTLAASPAPEAAAEKYTKLGSDDGYEWQNNNKK